MRNKKFIICAIGITLIIFCIFKSGIITKKNKDIYINNEENLVSEEKKIEDKNPNSSEKEYEEEDILSEENMEDIKVKIESIIVKKENIAMEEGEKVIIELEIIPSNADVSEIAVSSINNDVISIEPNIQETVQNIVIKGLVAGNDQVILDYGTEQNIIIDVQVEKKSYTLDNMPNGYFYSSGEDIFELGDSGLQSNTRWNTTYSWIDAEDYKEGMVLTLKRGDTIYAKGENVNNYIGKGFLEEDQGIFENKRAGDYYGYLFNKDISVNNFGKLSFYDLRTEKSTEYYDIEYINDQEISWSNYSDAKWGVMEPSLDEFITTTSKDEILRFGYYEGTNYKEIKLQADIWGIIAMGPYAEFEMTKEGYMYYTIPENCRSGYYYVYIFDAYGNGEKDYWFYVE